MNTVNIFGRKLRQLRKENSLTQEQLLKELNTQGYEFVHISTISRWENGLRKPSIAIIEDLEEILGANRGVLLRAAEYLVEISPTEQSNQAQLHDEIIFKQSDNIINEKGLLSFLKKLEFHKTCPSSTLTKIKEFRDLFSLEANKYVDDELTSSCDELANALNKLIHFVEFSFKGTEDIKTANGNDDTIFKFTPQNRYPREEEEYLEKLQQLVWASRDAYSSYRAAVRRILSV